MINNCLIPWFTETGAIFGTDIMHSGDSFSLTDKMWLIAVKRGTAYFVNTTVHKKTGLPQIDGAPCLGDFKCKQISTRPRASGEIFIWKFTGYGIDVSKTSVNLKIPGTHHRL